MKRFVWMMAQAAAIAWLTWSAFNTADEHPDPRLSGPLAVLVIFVMSTIMVAFATAVITNLWDWTHRQLQGLPFRAGRTIARLRTARRDARQAIEERDGRRARLRGGELRQPPAALWRSQ